MSVFPGNFLDKACRKRGDSNDSSSGEYGVLLRLIAIQSCIVLASSIAVFWLGSWPYVVSAFFGGGIALVNVLLMARRLRAAAKAAGQGGYGVIQLQAGAVERFVFTLGAFALGFGYWALPPAPMLAVFALAQGAFFIANFSEATLLDATSHLRSKAN
ncbi:MAG TPA: hypothetical protein ENI72_03170 [Rhodospirillales bacterium]|nr:hypothetical protein [Rhodospirillales bacterium]